MRKLLIMSMLVVGLIINANPTTIDTINCKTLNVLELTRLSNDKKQLATYKFRTYQEIEQLQLEKSKQAAIDNMWKGKLNDYFIALAKRESGNDYTIYNKYGYIGLWQLGRSALKTVGYGHITFQKFKQDPSIFNRRDQYRAVVRYTKIHKRVLQKHINMYVGKRINGVLITESGILGGAHIGGAGGMKKYLDSGGSHNPADANGTSIEDYLFEFSKYKMEFT